MCTAVTYRGADHYFGRNLDLDHGYAEQVCVTPRIFPFRFRKMPPLARHYAMIGMATVIGGYPLYYEATNEQGLSMAGLNFPDIACYLPEDPAKENVAPFEFIPWILGQCATVADALEKLERLNLADIPFSQELPLSPLHWIIADRERSIVVEPMPSGIKLFDDPIGVLTNAPGFDHQLYRLADHMGLTPDTATDRFTPDGILAPYCTGMGAIGLPGDWSSPSRFIRAAFVKLSSPKMEDEAQSVHQFFHILSSVSMPMGAVRTANGQPDITRYTCCCNTGRGIYYYTTYENRRITGIDMHKEDLDSTAIVCYPLRTDSQILMEDQEKDGHRL